MSATYTSTAFAYQVEGLFNAEVDVQDRSIKQRLMATKQAFEKVLTKVTGLRDLQAMAAIMPTDKEIESLVEQFRYEEKPVVTGANNSPLAPLSNTAPITALTLKLWVGFDASAVLRLLQKANLPVWDKIRTQSLVWIAIQDGSRRYLLEPGVHPQVKAFVEQTAAERGLPIVFPLMDLEDQSALTMTDVWGDFSDTIKIASKRYSPDAILVGRVIREMETFWSARWTLYQQGEVYRWESRAESKSMVIAEGVHGAADTLAKHFSQVLTNSLEPPLTMTILGIDDFDKYARAIKYLENLTQVSSMTVDRVKHGQVDISLAIRGNLHGLERVIELGGVLEKVVDSNTSGTAQVMGVQLGGESMNISKQGMVYRLP